jgi:hypothetical protein
MRSRLWVALVATICIIAPAQVVPAQQAAASTPTSTGNVGGVLKDPSGAVVAGASVELRSAMAKFRQTRISDHQGHFSFASVPTGDYQLTIAASGFASQVVQSITVVAGRELFENLSLKIAVEVAIVEVDGQDASSLGASALKEQSPNSAQSHNSADMLANVPGVSLHGNGELASIPFLHGLGDERAKIVVDGATVSSACPNHMNPTLSYAGPGPGRAGDRARRHHAGQPWRRQPGRHHLGRVSCARFRGARKRAAPGGNDSPAYYRSNGE